MKLLVFCDLEVEAVAVVLARDIARERVAPVRPPEARAVVWVERQHLLRQPLRAEGLHGEVAVEDVPLLGRVFEKEAVAARPVADAIAHEQMVGAVDGDPAVVRIPDARAEHAAAAHGVAHEVKMDRVFAEHAAFAEVPELRVADAARRVAMIHRVAADAGRLGGLDDDIAREEGDLAAHQTFAEVDVGQWLIERERVAFDLCDHAFLRGAGERVARRFLDRGSVILFLARTGDDDAVANMPSDRRVFERHLARARLRSRGELQPRPRHRRAVDVPASAAGHDGRQCFGIHAVEMPQTNRRGDTGGNWRVRRADFERRHRRVFGERRVVVTIKSFFAARLARHDAEQPDLESRVPFPRKRERARDVNHPQRRRVIHVVSHHVPRADLHALARLRQTPAPRRRIRPRTGLRGTDVEGDWFSKGKRSEEQGGQGETHHGHGYAVRIRGAAFN